jgi:hypothetical protein
VLNDIPLHFYVLSFSSNPDANAREFPKTEQLSEKSTRSSRFDIGKVNRPEPLFVFPRGQPISAFAKTSAN